MSDRKPSLQERILAALRNEAGLTDRALTDLLFGEGIHPSRINQECHMMADRGLILRQRDGAGAIRNSVPGQAFQPATKPSAPAPPSQGVGAFLSEDALKRHLLAWLECEGWVAQVAWGKTRGADILASRGGRSWIIEAKGSGTLQPMRVNYFLAALGELLQRMSDPEASYSIALPDLGQFRGLWQRLPGLAKRRLGISALFVAPDGRVDHALESQATSPQPERERLWLGSEAGDVTDPESDLAAKFQAFVSALYQRIVAETGYQPSVFIQMVHERGGLATARARQHAARPASGLTTLRKKGRLDLSVEAMGLQAPWYELFTEEERATARKRLHDFGYKA